MITSRTSIFQGLRLIGIVTIVAAHIGMNWFGGGEWCTFFFLLSGFLYRHQIRSWADYRQYIWKKVSRLYPIYWICLAAYLLLAWVRGCEEQSAIHSDFLPYFFVLQTWVPGLEPFAYLSPSWFLSSLLFCYVFSCIASYIVSRSKYSLLLILLGMFVWRYLGYEVYFSPIYRFFEYALGMWLHKWLCQGKQRTEIFPGFSILILVGVLISMHFGLRNWCSTLAFLLLIWTIYMVHSQPMSWLLGNKYVLRVAKSDIFIYLTHPGIGFYLVFFFIGTNPLITVIGSVLFGFLMGESYNWISRKISDKQKEK